MNDSKAACGGRKRGKGLIIGGAVALVLIGAGAASAGKHTTTAAQEAPTTVAPTATEAPTTVAQEAPTTVVTTTAPAPTTVPPPTAAETAVPLTFSVDSVIDGDTIDVVASDGSAGFGVRLIGIDAPESGSCEADAATWSLAQMVQGQQVVLTAGGDGEDTDRYGRYLRYVDVNGVDAGLRLLEGGLAVARYDSRDRYGAHDRELGYVAADDASPEYRCPPPATQPPPPAPVTQPAPTTQVAPPAPPPPAIRPIAAPGNGCDPNYTGCVPIASDVDCAGGSGNGPAYTGHVRVIGVDHYDLDRDGDGEACE